MPHHRPGAFFRAAGPPSDAQILIVLNQPLHAATAFARAFRTSAWRIVADGAADRLLHFARDTGADPAAYIPDLIVGDLDSISAHARAHFLAAGALVAHDPDQYCTDFGKADAAARALRRLPGRGALPPAGPANGVREWDELARALPAGAGDAPAADVLLFGGLGGRVDHGVGVLSEVARAQAAAAAAGRWRYWLVTERSVSWVLEGGGAGAHVLHLGGGCFSPNVGLLPVFGPVSVSTRGLEWDVADWRTEMGGDVSTSNHVVSADGVVEVETTGRVLFTVELAEELCR